jgi:WD40 repeat protein
MEVSLPSAVTVVSLSGGLGHRGRPMISCCCAGDGTLRVWQLEVDTKIANKSNDKVVLRHSFVSSDVSLTGCCVSGDGTLALAASLDNHVYW